MWCWVVLQRPGDLQAPEVWQHHRMTRWTMRAPSSLLLLPRLAGMLLQEKLMLLDICQQLAGTMHWCEPMLAGLAADTGDA